MSGEGSLVNCNNKKVSVITRMFIRLIIFTSTKEISFIINKVAAIIIPTTAALMPSSDL
jgi:hypothetical protein